MKKSYVSYKYLAVSLILLISLLVLSPVSLAQDEQIEDNPGGKMAFITKDDVLPQIEPNKWTYIDFTAIDQYDFNWTLFDEQFSDLYMKLVWPFMFGNLQIARYLGYTTVELYADIVDKNGNIAEGWSAQAVPSTISDTTQGKIHDVSFKVQAHDYSVDYSVKLRVKVTRKDTWGEIEGYSYIYIPLKVASLNYIEMVSTKSTKKAGPVSITEFQLQVTNKGYYEDIFRFDVKAENGLVGIVETQGLYIKPGETRTITLQVMTPEKFYDPGTSNNLDIYTWSRLNQTAVYIGSVNVITEGIYLSPLVVFAVAIVLLIIVCIFLFYYFVIRDDKTSVDEEITETYPKEEAHGVKEESKGFFSGLFKKETEEKQDEPASESEESVKVEEEKPVKKEKKVDVKKQDAISKVKKQQDKQKKK